MCPDKPQPAHLISTILKMQVAMEDIENWDLDISVCLINNVTIKSERNDDRVYDPYDPWAITTPNLYILMWSFLLYHRNTP